MPTYAPRRPISLPPPTPATVLSYTLHPFFSQRELFQNTSTHTLTFLPAEGPHSKPLPLLLESSLAPALAGGRRLRPHLAQVLLQLNLSPNLTHLPPAALRYQPLQTSRTSESLSSGLQHVQHHPLPYDQLLEGFAFKRCLPSEASPTPLGLRVSPTPPSQHLSSCVYCTGLFPVQFLLFPRVGTHIYLIH